MTRVRANRPLLAAALGFVALVAVGSMLPRPVTDEGPDGLSTLRRFLERRGVDVRPEAADPGPEEETFFLRFDVRSGRQVTSVLDWVWRGGRLVVADPSSALLRRAGFERGGVVGGLAPRQRLVVDCPLPDAAGTGAVVAASGDAAFRATAGTVGCFGGEDGWFLAERQVGAGTVVALGGVTPLTNAHLDDADDVVLAWNLLGSDAVAFGGPGRVADAGDGLWSLLPPAARVIAIQAVVAAIVFAVARGRRIGRRPEEQLPSPVAASELVDARGELYRASRSAAHAATVLRRRFVARAGRRLGHPADVESLVPEVARATGRPADDVHDILTEPVADEAALVRVAGRLEGLERRLEGDRT